jgi:hypothetical protein
MGRPQFRCGDLNGGAPPYSSPVLLLLERPDRAVSAAVPHPKRRRQTAPTSCRHGSEPSPAEPDPPLKSGTSTEIFPAQLQPAPQEEEERGIRGAYRERVPVLGTRGVNQLPRPVIERHMGWKQHPP